MSDPTPTGNGSMSRKEIEERLADIAARGGSINFKEAKRDWFTVGAVLFSALLTVGGWLWWGGRLSQRVDNLEDRQRSEEIRGAAQSASIALQAGDIQVIKSQVGDIKAYVDRQESRR